MKAPNPRDYHFLWLVNNMTYFENSFWLTPNFLRSDFLVTAMGSAWKVYISKKERERLSQYGLLFMQKKFGSYKAEVAQASRLAHAFFKKIKAERFTVLPITELHQSFSEAIRVTRLIWDLYFFTEYFLFDRIEQQIVSGGPRRDSLAKKVKQMQELKYNLRKLVNKTVFIGNIFEPYFAEITRRTKRKNLHHYHYRGVQDILAGKNVIALQRNNYVTGKFNSWQTLTGQQALRIIKNFDAYVLQTSHIGNELKGQTARPGFYRGKVRIIPFDLKADTMKKIQLMKKGEVLVTGSTGPEMILACKKAGAIVTEEGGIASHAAIVSRELGIPCVIGTKVATQVLKDGDLVEVDANLGVVRKLD